jgi:hypothetical protein
MSTLHLRGDCASPCSPTFFLRPYSHSVGLGLLLSFLILYTVGRTPWRGDQPVARPLRMHRTTQTSRPPVGFEPTLSVLELAKSVRALERTATVIGHCSPTNAYSSFERMSPPPSSKYTFRPLRREGTSVLYVLRD